MRAYDMDNLVRKHYEKIKKSKHNDCKTSLGDSCLHCITNMYRNDNDVNYECENKRFIYIARYLPVHSSEIYQSLTSLLLKFHEKIKKKKEIVLASFGAGPGIDTHAFHRWLNDHSNDLNCKKIIAYRIEACTKWTNLAKQVMFSNIPKNLEREYYRYNLNVTTDDININNRFDIATLSYIVSELDDDGITKLIKNIKNNKKDCSYIIINDRPETAVIEKINRIMKEVAKEGYHSHQFDNEHCGFTFPDDIYSEVKPKVFKKSIYFVGELK